MSILFSQKLLRNNEIRPQEAVFTEVLEHIAVKPKMLYFCGKIPENQSKTLTIKSTITTQKTLNLGLKNDAQNGQEDGVPDGLRSEAERPKVVAIVGTRRPTTYGAEIARELAYEVAKRGGVVVSGLAYGIDSVAHRGALEAGGVTVAVLGTPIDQIYPRNHIGLAEEIVATGGCVMSEVPAGIQVGEEYIPGVKYYPKTCFLQRNRLIAGLADAVVIPEAAERSGSLNTAAHALEQGREIFAVPGDIRRPLSKGCNRLLRQGATPYLGPEDVLDLLFPTQKVSKKWGKTEIVGDNVAETAILQALAAGVRDGEKILMRAGLEVVQFNQNITMLELKGRVRSLGANQWVLR